MRYVFAADRPFAPGANWSYSHSNFMILGEVLSRIGKKPLAALLQDRVLKPMKLKNTFESQTANMPSPFLHSFSVERRDYFKIPANLPFYEEESFLRHPVGLPGRCEPGHHNRRHGHDGDRDRDGRAPLGLRATTP